MSPAKLAVITGASRGLGLALVKEFTANGWQAVGTGRSAQPSGFPPEAQYRQFDASNAAECESFWQHLDQEHPSAQVCLVNNAGSYVSGSLLETKPEDYKAQMQSCYFTAVYMTRAMALVISKARITNIISSSALAAHQDNPAYGAAKAAEMHFFQSLQQEFKPETYAITNLYPDNIASHGDSPKAIKANDLAEFVKQIAEMDKTYCLRDVTMYPKEPTI